MTARSYGPNENGRFTLAELERLPGFRHTHGGTRTRSACPIHGGDNPQAFEVDLATGRGHCFTRGCWGYLDDGRGRRRDPYGSPPPPPIPRPAAPPPPDPERVADLRAAWRGLVAALPGSPAAEYLARRGIPLDVARAARVGFDAAGRLAPAMRGRVVFPLATLDGTPISAVGRVIRDDDRRRRWETLPGRRGYIHPAGIRRAREAGGTLYLCEGLFDALALLAAGVPTVAALCGTAGLKPEDVRGCARLVLCFDADAAGQGEGLRVGHLALSVGCEVWRLTGDELAGCKDLADYWQRHGALPPGLVDAPAPPAEPAPFAVPPSTLDPAIIADEAARRSAAEIAARVERLRSRALAPGAPPEALATLADWLAVAAARAELDALDPPQPSPAQG